MHRSVPLAPRFGSLRRNTNERSGHTLSTSAKFINIHLHNTAHRASYFLVMCGLMPPMIALAVIVSDLKTLLSSGSHLTGSPGLPCSFLARM